MSLSWSGRMLGFVVFLSLGLQSTVAHAFPWPWRKGGRIDTPPSAGQPAPQPSCPEVVVRYAYHPMYPVRGAQVTGEVKVALSQLQGQLPVPSDQSVAKTVFALKLIAAFERAIKLFDHEAQWAPYPDGLEPFYGTLEIPGIRQPYESMPNVEARQEYGDFDVVRPKLDVLVRRQPAVPTNTRNKQLAAVLGAEFGAFRRYALSDPQISSDAKLMGIIDLGMKLATNMDRWEPYRRSRGGLESLGTLESFSVSAAPKGLAVSAGGAQDAGQFRSIIENDGIPRPEEFNSDGLLRELNLNIPFNTQNLLAVQPSALVDPIERVIYLQLNTASVYNDQNFRRNPVNVTVALDISGSMSDADGTSKTRLDWAKASLKTMLRKLKPGDTVSVLLFDDEVYDFIDPLDVGKLSQAELAALEAKIDTIKWKGSTNIEKALEKAYQHAEKQMAMTFGKGNYENRVILISDAGHNTGGTREGIVARVHETGAKGIGTTAIALGLSFEASLADSFNTAKNGNQLFVQNGEQMAGLFNRFDYLVQPVAEDFRVAVEVSGLNTTVERAWGVNARPGHTSSLIAVPTLFFVNTDESGGGAMALALRYGTPDAPMAPPPVARPRDPNAGDRTQPAVP